jgi:hypothetical protein
MAKVIEFYVPTSFRKTVERILAAATREDYRVLRAGKEIRLTNEAHGCPVASEASSPLVQELGGRVSVPLRGMALRVCRRKQTV